MVILEINVQQLQETSWILFRRHLKNILRMRNRKTLLPNHIEATAECIPTIPRTKQCLMNLQAAVVSILLYGCTTWTLTKRREKEQDGDYTRMLRAILNKSWRQHPTKHQLYGHRPLITKTIQVRRTRHAGHCWRSRDELISDVLIWPSKCRTTSSNLHTAAQWGYGM